MMRFVQYFGQFQGFKTNLTGLPFWARLILTIFMLPGLILVGLSIVALLVSILALLLLTLPVYRLLRAITGVFERPAGDFEEVVTVSTVEPSAPTGRRQIDVKIVE